MIQKNFDYVVTLKQAPSVLFDTVSLLLCLIAAAIFAYFMINNAKGWPIYTGAIILILFQIGYNFYQKKNGKESTYTWGLIAAAMAMAFLPQHGLLNLWIGLLYLTAAFIAKQIKFPLQVGIDKNGISFSNLSKKTFIWGSLSNVILKDGLLTIDQKNNKLFQKEIQEQVTPEIETEFNAFCQSKLQVNQTIIEAH